MSIRESIIAEYVAEYGVEPGSGYVRIIERDMLPTLDPASEDAQRIRAENAFDAEVVWEAAHRWWDMQRWTYVEGAPNQFEAIKAEVRAERRQR